jgi:hypothetical protein
MQSSIAISGFRAVNLAGTEGGELEQTIRMPGTRSARMRWLPI